MSCRYDGEQLAHRLKTLYRGIKCKSCGRLIRNLKHILHISEHSGKTAGCVGRVLHILKELVGSLLLLVLLVGHLLLSVLNLLCRICLRFYGLRGFQLRLVEFQLCGNDFAVCGVLIFLQFVEFCLRLDFILLCGFDVSIKSRQCGIVLSLCSLKFTLRSLYLLNLCEVLFQTVHHIISDSS